MFLALVNLVCRAMYGIMGLPRMCPSIYPNHGTFEGYVDVHVHVRATVTWAAAGQCSALSLFPGGAVSCYKRWELLKPRYDNSLD